MITDFQKTLMNTMPREWTSATKWVLFRVCQKVAAPKNTPANPTEWEALYRANVGLVMFGLQCLIDGETSSPTSSPQE